MSRVTSNGQSRGPVIPPSALAFLKQLQDLYDPRVGLPIASHRKPPIGTILVVAKKGFRLLFQAFINETLRKQLLFNETLLKLLHVIYHDINSVEGATLAMRAGLQERLRKLEERLSVLEAVAREGKPRASEMSGGAAGNGEKN